MTNKFKVGDRVTCINIERYFAHINYYFNKHEIYTIFCTQNDSLYLHCKYGPCFFMEEDFELVERKFGDKWFKVDELNEDGTPIDQEISVHENSGKYGVYRKIKEFEDVIKQKEEFKVDKLGWYELRHTEDDSIEMGKCVYISEKHNECCFEINNELCIFDLFGNTTFDDYDYKVMKYLGLELPKAPRTYEFEIYISKNILEDKLDSLKYIHLTPDGLNEPIKFKLILEEIIDE